MQRDVMTRWLRAGVLIGATAFAAGCYTPGGGLMASSDGTYTYYSTETEQKTISIIDMRTGEPFFVQVIPPRHQLTLKFEHGGGDDPVYTPDRMLYSIFPMGTQTGNLTNQMTVPPASARRIDISVSQDVQYMATPPEQRLRTDQAEDRPDYWSPRGGPLPERRPIYD